MIRINSCDDEIIYGINVTPLVDVALLVLIIFIVTASVVLRSNVPLELPRAESSEVSSQGLLVVGVTKEGAIYLNGTRATIDDIPAAVAEARQRQPAGTDQLNVFVAADVAASYGAFAGVVDRLRLEGVTDIAMDTTPTTLPEPSPSLQTEQWKSGDGESAGSLM